MKTPPEPWRVQHGRDPEAELRRLRRRFESVSRRFGPGRATRFRRSFRWADILALALIAIVMVLIGVSIHLSLTSYPWPTEATLKHLAAKPSCAAARAVGLAPANRGEPGYWPEHDADNDGIACEPWPHRAQERAERAFRRWH